MEITRICEECSVIKGDECYQYTGVSKIECNLVTGKWYKIQDLIDSLSCAAFGTTTSTTTTTTTTNP